MCKICCRIGPGIEPYGSPGRTWGVGREEISKDNCIMWNNKGANDGHCFKRTGDISSFLGAEVGRFLGSC